METGDPLISNEQFVVGGEDTLRGYLASSAASDIGWRGTLELRSPNLFEKAKAATFNWLQGRVFYDTAWMRTLSPLPGSLLPSRLTGYGAGLTLKTANGLQLRGDVALRMIATGDGPTLQPAQHVRIHASAVMDF